MLKHLFAALAAFVIGTIDPAPLPILVDSPDDPPDDAPLPDEASEDDEAAVAARYAARRYAIIGAASLPYAGGGIEALLATQQAMQLDTALSLRPTGARMAASNHH